MDARLRVRGCNRIGAGGPASIEPRLGRSLGCALDGPVEADVADLVVSEKLVRDDRGPVLLRGPVPWRSSKDAFGVRDDVETSEPAVDGRPRLRGMWPNSSTCRLSGGSKLLLRCRFFDDVDMANTPFIRSIMAELPEFDREPSVGRGASKGDGSAELAADDRVAASASRPWLG